MRRRASKTNGARFRAILLTGLCLIWGAPAGAATHVALVIGNSAYTATSALKNPGADAEAMRSVLKALGFSVTLLLDANQSQMTEAVKDFAEDAFGAEVAVAFYAGHGMELGSGGNYLIPVDARLADDRRGRAESVSLQALRDAAGGARRLSLVIVDACRTNSFPASRRGSRGMERVAQQPRQIVLFSTQPGVIAEDGEGRALSPFTEALTERLRRRPDDDVRMIVSSLALRDSEQTPYVVLNSSFREGEQLSLRAPPPPADIPSGAQYPSDALADLFAAANAAAARGEGAVSLGPGDDSDLTPEERTRMLNAIRACWSGEPASFGDRSTNVTIAFNLRPNGYVDQDSLHVIAPVPTPPEARDAVEAARQALQDVRCQPLPAPLRKYSAWRWMQLTFNAKNMHEP
ncbi:caspase family protein [Neomegalonema perideroedes]|uniref:caspase family protein n=1 Tax=Neomegalonema perideroedes TaxID=217219 RepID=UPI0009FF3469|nr:caspase family protein [Neomegalonema perideroedes]